MPDVRKAAVAGRFYPVDPAVLEREVRGYLDLGSGASEKEAVCVVAPHAGYMYSGAIAGETYGRVRVPELVIVLCPNHTGRGKRRAVSPADAWDLPGAPMKIDSELRDRLIASGFDADPVAHASEHSAEVHLPFLRAKNRDARFVAICLARLSLEECRRAAETLVDVVQASEKARREFLIVASTDMSHYISADAARRMDAMAIERMSALDPEGLHKVVEDEDISMCGYVPTTIALFAARKLGGRNVELARYGNSGDTSGDLERVVGYAGLSIS